MNRFYSLSNSNGDLELLISIDGGEEEAIELSKMKILDIIKEYIDGGEIEKLNTLTFSTYLQVPEKVTEISVLVNEDEMLFYLRNYGIGSAFDFDTLEVYK